MGATIFGKLGLILAIIVVLFLVIVVVIVLVLVIILTPSTAHTTTTSTAPMLTVTAPKRMALYYGYPSLVQNANWNVTAATATFSQFDLIIFGDNISYSTHGDHANTQTIIGSLNALGKLTYGYIDLGMTTQNLSIARMQTVVNNWAAMGVKGIFWDDAGPMVLDSRDIYLLESFLISNGAYQNLTIWKAKADKCFNYAATYNVSMACVATTTTTGISASFGTSQQFSQAWFGTAMYDFDYFQVTDYYHSSTNNILYAFSNPTSSYGTYWKTSNVQMGSITNYYRSTNTYLLQIFGDGATYGSGNATTVSSG